MKSETATQPASLQERVQAALAVKVRPPVYVDIVNPSGGVSYRRWSDHPDVQEALGTQGYTVRRSDAHYELEGESHPLCALLAETAAALAAAQAERDAYRAALTPSTETKGAYMGEFQFDTEVTNPSWDEDSDEEDGEPEYLIERTAVPWDTIKQIMAAISARAALGGAQ